MTPLDLEFTIPGEPVSWKRGNFVNGRVVTPRLQKAIKRLIGSKARLSMGPRPIVQGPVEVDLRFYFKAPAKPPTSRHVTKRPDLDNLEKLVFDALNDVVWRDDAQVWHVVKAKQYAVEPHTVVRVRETAI